jgi:hypothetical protein
MQNLAITILLGVSLAAFGQFGKFAFDMRRDKRYPEAAFWAFLAVVPGFGSALYLTTTMGATVSLRNWVLAPFGAAVGAASAIWIGYLVGGDPASATPNLDNVKTPAAAATPIQQNNQGPGQQFNAPGGSIIVNPGSPDFSQDPNGIYQLGNRVGTAIGANIILSQGRAKFAEIYGAGNLNDQQTFEYQKYVLKFISADGKPRFMHAMTLFGLSKSGAMQQNIVPNVECEIVGTRK